MYICLYNVGMQIGCCYFVYKRLNYYKKSVIIKTITLHPELHPDTTS